MIGGLRGKKEEGEIAAVYERAKEAMRRGAFGAAWVLRVGARGRPTARTHCPIAVSAARALPALAHSLWPDGSLPGPCAF